MIYVGCDHGGYQLKLELLKYLEAKGFDFEDMGCNGETVDYPDIAEKVCRKVLENSENKGLLICGTGIGISIAANRHKGIRAALLYNIEAARLAKQHNNANVIVFGGRTMKFADVVSEIDAFMAAEYEGGRHQRRLDKLDKGE